MSIAAPHRDGASRTQPPSAELSKTPSIKGVPGAHEYIHHGLKIRAVTNRSIRDAAERREVEVFMIGGAYWFSEQGLYDWVMSLRQGGVQR